MARIQTKEPILSMTGKLGTSTASTWKGITCLRSGARAPTNALNIKRPAVRQAFGELAKRWKTVLTELQRGLWEAYAALLKKRGCGRADEDAGIRDLIPENRREMSGYNAFMKINAQWRSIQTFPPITYKDDPPTDTVPNPPTDLTCECLKVAMAGNIIRLRWSDPVGIVGLPPFSGFIRPWLFSQDAHVHRQYQFPVLPTFEVWEIYAVFQQGGQFVQIWDNPGHYLFQVDYISNDGQKSTGSNVVACEVLRSNCPPWTPM